MDDIVKLLSEYLPFWDGLTPEEKTRLAATSRISDFEKGQLIHNGSSDCIGLLLVISGRLRVYTVSDEGRELTLYRLFERDMCLFSASCMLNDISFDVSVSAEEQTRAVNVSAEAYKALMSGSAEVANYTNRLMATHFSDVMWLMDQIMNKRLDSRLSALLLEESELSGSKELNVTHEYLGSHIGSPREVVTRMLKYLREEGLVALSRGSITIINEKKLRAVAANSLR